MKFIKVMKIKNSKNVSGRRTKINSIEREVKDVVGWIPEGYL